MAGRVNVKFVVLLSIVLVAVAGGVGTLAALIIFKSGEDFIRLGDAKMAEGDYAAAENYYSRAVNRDQFNAEWLRKWRTALEKWVPATRREFENEYHVNYRGLHRQLALSDLNDTEAQRDYLELLYQQLMFSPYSRQGYEMLASEAETFIKHHQAMRPGDVSWEWLKRYRAIPIVRQLTAGGLPSDDQIEVARADLMAALEADPDDFDAAEALALISLEDARKVRERGRADLAPGHEARALEILDEFLSHAGDATAARTSGQVMHAQVRLVQARDAASRATGRLAGLTAADVAGDLALEMEAIFEEAEMIPAGDLDWRTLDRLRRLELACDPEGGAQRTERLLDRALTAKPSSADLLMLRAALLTGRNEFDSALATYQAVVDLPALPVTFEGFTRHSRKLEALHGQAAVSLRAMELAQDDESRERWAKRVAERRAAFAAQVPDDSPALMMLDIKARMIERDYAAAQPLLHRYNDLTASSDPDALWFSALTARELNQPGVVKQRLERLLEIAPDTPNGLLMLADVERELRNNERSLELYKRYNTIAPGNEAVAERIDSLEKQIGIRRSDDPVEAAYILAGQLYEGTSSRPPDAAAAMAVLVAAIEKHGPHPMLSVDLARLRIGEGDISGARAIVEQSLAQHPDDATLQRMAAAMSSDDPVVMMANLIAQSDRTPARKHLALYQLYNSHGRTAEAESELRQAVAIAPEDPGVVEMQFMRAVSASNLAEARRLADVATRLDADRAGGLTFRARLESLEGRGDVAAATLTEATRRDPMNAGVWRLLARQQLANGNGMAALSSYARALEIRPNDVGIIVEQLRVMVQLERLSQALETARRAEPLARGNDDFTDILLDLEAAVGNRNTALERRERLHRLRPDDRRTMHSLASLYIDSGRWEDARKLIDILRRDAEDRAAVMLDARWYAEQGNMESARRVFVDYLIDQPPEGRLSGYLALGQFMMQRGQTDVALRAFEQAREHQSPTGMEADKALANTLLLSGRNEQAVQAFKRVLDSGADDATGTYRKRYAEALIRTGRHAEAESALAALANAESDVQAALLRAEAFIGRGQAAQARQLLERAVSRWPDDPMVYLKRAQALALEPTLRRDAIADLDRALQLRPDFWQGLRVRAQILMEMGMSDEALRDLRAAVRLNPSQDELRSSLIRELLRMGRNEDALSVADEAFRARPNDLHLRVQTAELFVGHNVLAPAAQMYRVALSRTGEPVLAQRLLEILLAQQPPALAEAEAVLNEHRGLVENDPGLLLARARVFAERAQIGVARRDALRSITLLQQQPDLMVTWFGNVRTIFKNDADLLSLLDEVARQTGMLDWATLFRARVVLSDPKQANEGLRLVDALLSRNPEPQIRFAAYRAKAGTLYEIGRYDEAIAIWEQSLRMDPGNWQVKNNIAFTLAKHLNRPGDALPYAQEAVSAVPTNADVLDTLGMTLLALGRAEEAIETLEHARQVARGTSSMAAITIHLAAARLDVGDKPGAKALVEELQTALERGLVLNDQYQRELQDLVEWVKD
ncbi:MAG: tetratricopeptide repeat protein [Phycisphaeraceae bacterium]|nr:tetratricopeptide repeat protein [Phycisphaeraceae bacterium]